MAALKAAGVEPPAQSEVRGSCGEAAVAMLETTGPAAAVISSYAQAALEGCGAVERGSLRVVGKTAPVPFVTVFATEAAGETLGDEMARALLELRDIEVLSALESLQGFVRAATPASNPPTSRLRAKRPESRLPARARTLSWNGIEGRAEHSAHSMQATQPSHIIQGA